MPWLVKIVAVSLAVGLAANTITLWKRRRLATGFARVEIALTVSAVMLEACSPSTEHHRASPLSGAFLVDQAEVKTEVWSGVRLQALHVGSFLSWTVTTGFETSTTSRYP